MTREAKNRSLAYAPQDANVATGEFLFREGERRETKRQMSEVLLFFELHKKKYKKKALPMYKGNAPKCGFSRGD